MLDQKPCTYQKEYADVGSKESLEYRCSRMALVGQKYCELHSPVLWESDPDLVDAAFKQELERSPGDKAHRRFVGFHLPDVDLSGQPFDEPIYFQYTKFHGRAVFTESVFAKEASFRECVFEGLASFKGARFAKANFFGAKARQHLSFSYAVFSDSVLLGVCVVRNADFRYARFSEVLARESEFEDADFSHAHFGGYCDLKRSSFGSVSFRNARFTVASITGVKFRKKADFGLAAFERPKDVRFDSDLTRVSFLGTDLSRVRFGSRTVWSHGPDPLPYDVRKFKENPKNGRVADALSVLRDLRDNYEYRLEYEWAGKLFVQEMEIKRQYEDADGGAKLRPRCWRWFSLTRVYGLLCRYGESLWRPSAVMLLVFAGFAFGFGVDESFANEGTCPREDSDRLEYALTRTLAGLFHWGCQELPDYALRGLSIPVLGTIFVVLRRRFERRFRH